MSFAIYNVNAINEIDLTTPASAQNAAYVLGGIYQFRDSSAPNAIKRFMYIKANGALTAYQPYRITGSGTSGAEFTSASFISLAGAVTVVGIPQVAFTSGYYGFVQLVGACTVLSGSAAIAAGSSLKVYTSGTTAIVDSSAGTQSIGTWGYATAAATTAATTVTALMVGGGITVTSS